MIPLAKPLVGPREEELVLETLRSRRLALGPRLGEFEERLAGVVGHPVSAVSSGTAGLHLAIRAAGVEAGDEVVTTPFSFVASANCLLYENARPVFCDIDPRTLNIDPAAAAAAVGERTTGLLPVHIFGYPADLPALERLAAERGLWIVEDACEALGARHADGVTVGARGHLSVFGFYPNKQITTGEGGAVVCPDAGAKQRIDSERNQGRAPDMGWLDHDRLGFNYRLDDLSCALGIAQLERLDELLAGRARVAASYSEALADVEDLALPCADAGGDRRSWFVFAVQLPRGVDRDAAVTAMRERGVDTKPYLPAIHLMSFYRERFGHREGEFPVCEDVARRSLALPFFGELTDGQVEQVVGGAARDDRGSAERLDERHEPRQPARRRAVGHLLEALARIQGARLGVALGGVERDRAQAVRQRLALRLREQRGGGAAPAEPRVGGERVDVEGVRRWGRRRTPADPGQAQRRQPLPGRRAAQRQPQEGRRSPDRLRDGKPGQPGRDAPVQLGQPDDLRARGGAGSGERALE